MKTQKMESKIEYRVYCENCRVEFMTQDPEKICPVCKNKEQIQEQDQEPKKENRKGGSKND